MGIILPVELLVPFEEICSNANYFTYSKELSNALSANGIVLANMETQRILSSGEINFDNINNNEYVNIYNIIHILHHMRLLNLIHFGDEVYDNFARAIMNPNNDRHKYNKNVSKRTTALFDKYYRDYYAVLKAWYKEINCRNKVIFDALLSINSITIDSFEEMEIYYLYFQDEWGIDNKRLIALFNAFIDTNINNIQSVALFHLKYPKVIPVQIKMRLVQNNCVGDFIKAMNHAIRSNYYALEGAMAGGVFENEATLTPQFINPDDTIYKPNDFYYNLSNETKLGVLL